MNEIEEDEIDIGKIFEHLKRNIKSIIFITVLITSMAMVYAYFLQAIYSSSVTISFSDDQKMSKLSSIIPDDLSSLGITESKLESTKLTIETRKFINSVIKDMSLAERFFVENNFKKKELYSFEELEVTLEIHDESYMLATTETLYGTFFKIEPINSEQYLLSIDELDYSKIHSYNKTISKSFFTINISRNTELKEKVYFIKQENQALLADAIL
ncbi:MAG TPA: hypothetical protein EYG80_01640, partial [Flavobacteriaceae bacterium]|nr:hypothetical protein [Flavobacteriaceae bacterium]